MEGLFEAAETYLGEHFQGLKRSPEQGTIHVGDDRYVLVRASSLTTGFLETMRDLIGEDEALKFWYRMARIIGRDDARSVCERGELTDPLARLSTGPVHFAYTGWARVEIDEASRPASDETYYMEYIHPNTFESETWIRGTRRAEKPVCVFSAGYSAGWCTESFDIDVHAREVTCVAVGHAECRFIMAPWEKLDGYEQDLRARLALGT
jgi:predicted hydrocarbon binding protein